MVLFHSSRRPHGFKRSQHLTRSLPIVIFPRPKVQGPFSSGRERVRHHGWNSSIWSPLGKTATVFEKRTPYSLDNT